MSPKDQLPASTPRDNRTSSNNPGDKRQSPSVTITNQSPVDKTHVPEYEHIVSFDGAFNTYTKQVKATATDKQPSNQPHISDYELVYYEHIAYLNSLKQKMANAKQVQRQATSNPAVSRPVSGQDYDTIEYSFFAKIDAEEYFAKVDAAMAKIAKDTTDNHKEGQQGDLPKATVQAAIGSAVRGAAGFVALAGKQVYGGAVGLGVEGRKRYGKYLEKEGWTSFNLDSNFDVLFKTLLLKEDIWYPFICGADAADIASAKPAARTVTVYALEELFKRLDTGIDA